MVSSHKIKVGIIQPFIKSIGGLEDVIARQVENLPEYEWTLYGLDFDEVMISRHYPSLAGLKKVKALNLVDIRLPSRFRRREILDLLEVMSFYCSGLKRMLDREDVLIAHYPFSTLASLWTSKPVIWYCHCMKRYLYETWVIEEYEKIWGKTSLFYRGIKAALAALEKKAAAQMRFIYCNSDNTKEKVSRYLGKVGIVNPPAITFPGKDQVEYEDFVIFPSRLVHYKRVADAVAAMKYVPQVRLKVIGAGPEEKRLKEIVKSKSLANVEFLEPQNSLDEHYQKCLAVIYLSRDEDYGIVPREAMAWKKPVIAAKDGGGICEAVIDGRNGFLVDPDPKEIAEKMKILFENRELAKEMGEAGYDSVKGLTWQNHAQKLREKINELVKVL